MIDKEQAAKALDQLRHLALQLPGARRRSVRTSVATRGLHVAAEERARQFDEVTALGVDEVQRAVAGLVPTDPLQDPHLLQCGQMHLAAEVHRLPAWTQIRRRLHDRDVELVPGRPVGQGRPGDARTRDQNLLIHCRSCVSFR
jgi:hypothetical protein